MQVIERIWQPVLGVLLFAVVSCVGVPEEGETGRLGLGLTMPTAEIGEIRSIGLFALQLRPPEFECPDYEEGTVDPIASIPESLVAVDYVDLAQASSGDTVSFRGVPTGELSIIVEAYDGGGTRIFMGCGQALVEVGRTTPIEVTLVEDPRFTEE